MARSFREGRAHRPRLRWHRNLHEPLRKACGNAIAKAGGKLIVLSPEGFGERWHPGPKHEPFCADGRMLFLSLYPEMARQPTRKELYDRCHEMGDVVLEGLTRP